jgi:hypothetical protein
MHRSAPLFGASRCQVPVNFLKALSYNLIRLEVLIRLRKLPIDGMGVPARWAMAQWR